MATQLEYDDQHEEIDLTGDGEQQDEAEQVDQQDEPEEGFIGFDGEEQEQAADTPLVKHLRQQLRERDRKLSEVSKSPPAVEEPIVVGARPTMEACEYDQERFDQELDAWDQRREEKRQQDARQSDAQRQQQQQWEQVTTNYRTAKQALPYRDKDVAEAKAFEELTPAQQAVIARHADKPALLIYALGRSPAQLSRISSINPAEDLGGFLKAVIKAEMSVKVGKRTSAPEPETVVRGTTVRSGSDKQLEKLEREADRTGNRTALIDYKRKMKGGNA